MPFHNQSLLSVRSVWSVYISVPIQKTEGGFYSVVGFCIFAYRLRYGKRFLDGRLRSWKVTHKAAYPCGASFETVVDAGVACSHRVGYNKMQSVMLGFSPFGRKPRQFNYIPRYWDPENEEREKRLNPEKEEQKPYVPGAHIRDSRLNRLYGRDKKKKSGSSPFLMRALIALLLLVFFGWVIFKSPVVEMFVMGLTK